MTVVSALARRFRNWFQLGPRPFLKRRLRKVSTAEKRAWRERARALRAENAAADAAAADLAPLVRADPAWDAARTVALYLPHGPWEPDTAAIVADCRRSGRAVAVPAWDRDARTYFWAALDPDAPLESGPLGIPQPAVPRRVAPDAIDLFLVPGVLFDRAGTRLGHGAGHLDRLLAPRRPDATVLGLARPWQIVAETLPREPHDAAVDRVLAVG